MWELDYTNDPDNKEIPGWWEVSDGVLKFRASTSYEADWLCCLLNEQDSKVTYLESVVMISVDAVMEAARKNLLPGHVHESVIVRDNATMYEYLFFDIDPESALLYAARKKGLSEYTIEYVNDESNGINKMLINELEVDTSRCRTIHLFKADETK